MSTASGKDTPKPTNPAPKNTTFITPTHINPTPTTPTPINHSPLDTTPLDTDTPHDTTPQDTIGITNCMLQDIPEELKQEEEKDLFIPVPQFSEDEFDFKISNETTVIFLLLTQRKFHILVNLNSEWTGCEKKGILCILNRFRGKEDGWNMVEILWNGIHL
jgi:hypothetical protein